MDDDDRDFRRSKRHDADGSSGGGVKKITITAPIGSGSVGGAGRPGLGKKRTINPVPDSGTWYVLCDVLGLSGLWQSE